MISSSPFAELSASISPAIMQTYVVIMIILVAGGTLFDVVHKKSAKYFFDNWRNAKNKAVRKVSGGEMASLAIQTAAVDVLTSGEFCNPQPQNCPSHHHVRLPCLRDHNRDHGVLVCNARHASAPPSYRSCGTSGR